MNPLINEHLYGLYYVKICSARAENKISDEEKIKLIELLTDLYEGAKSE